MVTRVLSHLEGSLEMHCNNGVEVFFVHIGDHAVTQNSGIVDQAVKATELLQGCGNGFRALIPIGDRGFTCYRSSPAAAISRTTAVAGSSDPSSPPIPTPASTTGIDAPWRANSGNVRVRYLDRHQ